MVHWADFNVAQFPSERLGEAHFRPTIMEFSDYFFIMVLWIFPL